MEQKNRFHLRNSEIAILYRTNSQSRIFEEYLRRQNILYRVYGGLSFYQRKEVKDLLAYLRLSINQNDEEALKRVINYPRRGIGKASIDKIVATAIESGNTMWDALAMTPLSARAKNSIANFVKIINSIKKKAISGSAYEAAIFATKASGLLDELKKDTTLEGVGRLENVNSLLDGIKDFVENDELIDVATLPDKTLASYLQNIALHTSQDNDEDDGDYVTLMSVHSAKGLEFKSVFVTGMEENLFPSFMSLDSREGLDEERRLFYVAITRAEQLLTLSYAKGRYKFGELRNNAPSRFLSEIPLEHLSAALSVRSRPTLSSEGGSARVVGNFKGRRGTVAASNPVVDPKNFKPNHHSEIQTGMKILHLKFGEGKVCLLYTSPSPRDQRGSRMPSSA